MEFTCGFWFTDESESTWVARFEGNLPRVKIDRLVASRVKSSEERKTETVSLV